MIFSRYSSSVSKLRKALHKVWLQLLPKGSSRLLLKKNQKMRRIITLIVILLLFFLSKHFDSDGRGGVEGMKNLGGIFCGVCNF